jgi:hypothetical protein
MRASKVLSSTLRGASRDQARRPQLPSGQAARVSQAPSARSGNSELPAKRLCRIAAASARSTERPLASSTPSGMVSAAASQTGACPPKIALSRSAAASDRSTSPSPLTSPMAGAAETLARGQTSGARQARSSSRASMV